MILDRPILGGICASLSDAHFEFPRRIARNLQHDGHPISSNSRSANTKSNLQLLRRKVNATLSTGTVWNVTCSVLCRPETSRQRQERYGVCNDAHSGTR